MWRAPHPKSQERNPKQTPTKILTVRQPAAWFIFNGKPVENRSWATNYRGPVLIHAGARKPSLDDWEYFDNLALRQRRPIPPRELPYGAIIGVVDIVGCVTSHRSVHFEGKYGFVLANPRLIDGVPTKGKLGLCAAPSKFTAKYIAQLVATRKRNGNEWRQ